MSLFIHITPKHPPAICGLGDYATVVGTRIEADYPGVRCGYVAGGHQRLEDLRTWPMRRNVTGTTTGATIWNACRELVAEQSASAEHAAIVLHYSGYGYDPSGAPTWLAEALEKRPPDLSAIRVVTFFHELYATGRPWQRAFWASRRQRSVAALIARHSDVLITNREQSARWLETATGRQAGSIPYLPVCSNVGEPSVLAPWDERLRRAVTFGSATFKAFALQREAAAAAHLFKRLGIEELVDIGEQSPVAAGEFSRHGVRVTSVGRLPADEVSEILQSSRVGFLDYPPDFLAKSGIFAAFSSHGVVPVLRSRRGKPGDSLAADEHFFALPESEGIDAAALPRAATRVFQWYRKHDSGAHAQLLADLTLPPRRLPATISKSTDAHEHV